MEKREGNLIKHTNYIYEYTDAIDTESADNLESVLREETKNISPSVEYLKETRRNNAWNLGIHQHDSENILKINKYLEEVGYSFLSRYYRDCPLVGKYHYINGSVGSAMNYRVYDERDEYNWHVDISDKFRLLVAFILYLNDDFEGGETLFLNDRLKISPKKGSVLMFPCGPYFVHKSTPIKSGRKSIIWDCYYDIPKSLVETLQKR